MNLAEQAYSMPRGVLLHEAGKQFAMAEIIRDGWQQFLYERGGWFLLLVHAECTAGVPGADKDLADALAFLTEVLPSIPPVQRQATFVVMKAAARGVGRSR